MTRTERVARAFSAAAGTYEAAAKAQDMAAGRLAELILGRALPAAPRVLEIGCGTGLLTRRLLAAIPGGTWLVTDIAPAMLDAARLAVADPRPGWRVMNGEQPDVPVGSCDLVVSNLAAQWFGNLGEALATQAACLAPDGQLALSLPGAGSFAEWRQVHDDLHLPCGVPDFPDAENLAACFPAGGRLDLLTESFAVEHESGLHFARSLKALGAVLPRPEHEPLSPHRFRKVLARLPGPFSVTYVLHYALWRKEAA